MFLKSSAASLENHTKMKYNGSDKGERQMKKYITFGCVLAVSAILCCVIYVCHSRINPDKLNIYCFDAGKADACVISKGESHIMIDTGEENLSEEILAYFAKNNITSLDYLIITHFDKDHVGSAAAVIDSVDIKNVLQSNVPKESEYYDNYLNSLEAKGMEPLTISGDYGFEIGDLKFNVNGPAVIYDKNESNNSSLITSLSFGDRSFIFMGDAQNDRLKDFISANTSSYDLVKIPYHGHYQKRLENLLESITPKYAVITSSEDEREDEETLELLDEFGVSCYLTREGDILISSDGSDIKIKQ